MIVDTSALIAILRDEQDAMTCAKEIANATVRRISAANYVETAAVIDASQLQAAGSMISCEKQGF